MDDDDIIRFGLFFYSVILMCSYLDISRFAWNIPGWKQGARLFACCLPFCCAGSFWIAVETMNIDRVLYSTVWLTLVEKPWECGGSGALGRAVGSLPLSRLIVSNLLYCDTRSVYFLR